ncbi:acyltransferase family protein [Massilia sp. TSP1-1-2]|uniref:acyltransferase family protein n=1 Tax=Massilia sp. TSP1-1-2 TaxID=2804649 RepID=UPI003CEC3DB8
MRNSPMTDYLSKKIKILSFLAIVMVVLVHAYNQPERVLHSWKLVKTGENWNAWAQLFISNGVARYGIPFFFLVSGWLNYRKARGAFADLALTRLRTLALPYFLWSAISLFVFWLAQQNDFMWALMQANPIGPFATTRLADYSASQWWTRSVVYPVAFQLWFLRDLFVCSLLAPLLIAAFALPRALVALMFAGFAVLFFNGADFYLVEGEGLLFFSAGLLLAHCGADVQQAPRWFRLRWWAVLWLAVIALKTGLAFAHWDVSRPLAIIALYRLSQVMGIAVVWFGYDRVMRGAAPAPAALRMASHAFIVYVLHVPLLNLATQAALTLFGNTDAMRFAVYAGSAAGSIGVCVLAGRAMTRWAPTLSALLTGGRATPPPSTPTPATPQQLTSETV